MLAAAPRVLAAGGEGNRQDGSPGDKNGHGKQGRSPENRDPRSPFSDDDPLFGRFGGSGGNGPSRINWLYGLLIVVLVVYLVMNVANRQSSDPATELTTSQFVTAVEEGRVDTVTYTVVNGALDGTYWKDAADVGTKVEPEKFTSTYVGSDSLSELMAEHPKVTYNVNTDDPNFLAEFLTQLLPTVLLVVVMYFFMRQMLGANNKAMQFGKTNAKTNEATRPKVKFKDVAGIDEAVEELQEVKDFLAHPERYRKLGAKIPRGVLLVGPPGTGKTLLAKAVAGEAGVPFFSISGSDFVEMFVGVGASRVRDLFKEAKAQAPSIIFIDEIDAVGRQRGAGLGGGHDEREQTLNQLLVEMDGFEETESVILIAATNRPDILDPALLRPGRFDRQITVDRPDVAGREEILKVHADDKPMDPSIDFAKLAKLTVGFTGADLANLLNEAALLAARRNHSWISMDEIEESMERVIAGPAKKARVMTETERTTIAYHESGHALVGHVLEHSDPVHKITIIPRGQALGYTMQLPAEDHYLKTKNELLDELAVFLGGRVAEELMCDDVTSGASNDLERATKMAREMVTRLGMSEALGVQVFGEAQHQVFLGRDYADHQDYSEETARRIDEEVQRIMREAHDRAEKILLERRDQLDLMARVLLARETVEGDAVTALLNNTWDEYVAAHPEEAEPKAGSGASAAEKSTPAGAAASSGSTRPGSLRARFSPEAEAKLRDEAARYAQEAMAAEEADAAAAKTGADGAEPASEPVAEPRGEADAER